MNNGTRCEYDSVNAVICSPEDHEQPSAMPVDLKHVEIATPTRIVHVLRALCWTVYVPTALLAVGNSLTYPTLPLYAQSLDLDGIWLGIPLAGLSLGRLGTNILSGQILAILGIRATMVLSFIVSAVAALLASLSLGFNSLTFSLLLLGFGSSLEAMGRMTYSKMVVSNEHRGRVVAVTGGTNRIGSILGPAIGGIAAKHNGLRAPFRLQIPLYLCAAIMCAVSFPTKSALDADVSASPSVRCNSGNAVGELGDTVATASYRSVLRSHWRLLLTVGGAMFFLQFLRGARVVLIPLFGNVLGLAPDRIGMVVTASFLVDSCLFPVVGSVSDSYGRKCLGTPAFVLLTSGILTLCFSTSFSILVLAAALAGLGNGFSSGLVMTTGVDVAPPHPETPLFLGLYGGFYDSGDSLAPILIGAIAGISDFKTAGLMTVTLGLLGVPWYALLVPESRESLEEPCCRRCCLRRRRRATVLERTPITSAHVVGKVVQGEMEVLETDVEECLTCLEGDCGRSFEARYDDTHQPSCVLQSTPEVRPEPLGLQDVDETTAMSLADPSNR